MRDRYVRGLMLGLIFAFPVLLARMSPPPPSGASAIGAVAAVEAVLGVGLFGAYRARRGLLAGRGALAAEAHEHAVPAHFTAATVEAAVRERVGLR